MRRIVIIGRWSKDRKTTVIDLQAYREMRQKEKEIDQKQTKDAADQKKPVDI